MADEVSNKCKHGPCDCPAEQGSKYCGEYCKEADKSHVMEIGCGCEHDGCRREAGHSIRHAKPFGLTITSAVVLQHNRNQTAADRTATIPKIHRIHAA